MYTIDPELKRLRTVAIVIVARMTGIKVAEPRIQELLATGMTLQDVLLRIENEQSTMRKIFRRLFFPSWRMFRG